MGVRSMQGVSAQIETLHKKPGEKRRLPVHFIYCEGKAHICTCPQAGYYLDRCKSSKNCDFYEEKE